MASVVSLPDGGLTRSGNWSTHISTIHTRNNDSNDATLVYNTRQNQDFTLSLDMSATDVGTMIAMQQTLRFKAGGKGTATCTVTVNDGSSTYINAEAFSAGTTSFANYNGAAHNITSIGGGQTQANNLQMVLTTTGGTQNFIAEYALVVTYNVAGYGHDVMSVASANISSVIDVTSANIDKIIGVD